MPKRSKLLQALDEHKGRDYDAEKQKKMVKAAKKRKGVSGEEEEKEAPKSKKSEVEVEAEAEDEESQDDNDFEPSEDNASEEEEEDIDEDDEEAEDEEEEEDIPLSDLEDADLEDVVPHQRLTINNSAALTASTKRVSFITHLTPFSEHNSLLSKEEVPIPDPNDDLNRELAFYKIAQSAAVQARGLLKKEGISFTRPGDYFAEMVKTDEHMGKIKKKLFDEAAGKKAAAEARKQRDLKKFGKQVQVAKLQQRAREKKESLEKINELKKKRKTAGPGAEADDLFDVAVEDAVGENSSRKRGRAPETSGPGMKRQKKNEKFGFGGKKRHSKSGDAASSADLRSYSVKKMKGGSKGGSSRPGKSKRAAAKGRN